MNKMRHTKKLKLSPVSTLALAEPQPNYVKQQKVRLAPQYATINTSTKKISKYMEMMNSLENEPQEIWKTPT